MNRILILLLVIFTSLTGLAQVNVKDSVVFTPMANVFYIAQMPDADLNDRFGFNNNVGGSFMIKNRKNWIMGFSGAFMFGDHVKELNMLDGLMANFGGVGMLITKEGNAANELKLIVSERGYNFSAHFGKLFNHFGSNKNSGLVIVLGLGFLEHYIKFTDVDGLIPQIREDYAKGYDRLTNGLMISQFIGYRYFGDKRLLNFFAGFEFQQAFTKNRRSYNWDTMKKDDTERIDVLHGFKVGWTVPFYKRTPKDFYYD